MLCLRTIIHAYFFERYSSILAFFFKGESSSAHALSFNKPTTTPKPFSSYYIVIDILQNLCSKHLQKIQCIIILLPCEIFPRVYSKKCQSQVVITTSYR